MDHFRFPKQHRLLRSSQFAEVYQRRRSSADDVLIVYGRENQLEVTRLGLTVSRKVGGAVLRNRWKRILREAFRLSRSRLPEGIDLVVSPRRDANPELASATKSLVRLAERVRRKLTKDSR